MTARSLSGLLPQAHPVPSSATGQVDALQSARAVAAVLVVIYHANNFVLPMRLYDGGTAWQGFGWGYAGVEFFFVLSGFIIAQVHRQDIGRPDRIPRFLGKRLRRIYPMYWLVLTAVIGGLLALGGTEAESLRRPETVVTSYLLIPSEDRTILPVAWTLKHEMLFYLGFVLFLLSGRLGATMLLLWMTACAASLAAPPTGHIATFLLSPYNLLFGFGVATAQLFPHLPVKAGPWMFAAGIGGFCAIGFSEQFLWSWPLGLRTIGYGLSAMAIIAVLARSCPPVPHWSVFLGDASYAIYLIHLPAMNAVALVAAKLGLLSTQPPLIALAELATVGVLAGALAHVLLERPLLAWLARPVRTGAQAGTKARWKS